MGGVECHNELDAGSSVVGSGIADMILLLYPAHCNGAFLLFLRAFRKFIGNSIRLPTNGNDLRIWAGSPLSGKVRNSRIMQ